MKTNSQRRGSVLMEFIIVFPIYLVLFAGTVMLGDMLIHSNRLASADRVAAFGVEGWSASGWERVTSSVFHPQTEIADDGSRQDVLSQKTDQHYAEESGPWSVCAAATAQDSYKPLAGGTLGQLLGARVLMNTAANPLPRDLLPWEAGSGVMMRSKGTDVANCFYVLKRRRGTSSWRDMISGLLLNDWWLKEVVEEKWFNEKKIEEGFGHCKRAENENIESYRLYDWPHEWVE